MVKREGRWTLPFERKAFYSPREYAAIAGIDPSTVLDHIHSEKLYAVKLSERIYRIPLAQVLSKLHPEMIGEPRFRHSRDPEKEARRDLERDRAEHGKSRVRRRAAAARRG